MIVIKNNIFAQSVCQLAIKAGDAIMEYYKSDFKIELKEDESPVTQADLASNKIIEAGLSAIEDIPILTEENIKQIHASRYWCVDPLDGTKSFIGQQPHFTVNIGIVDNNKSVFGVIYAPAINRPFGALYFAEKGKGAFEVNIQTNELTQIQARPTLDDEDTIIMASKNHSNETTLQIIKEFQPATVTSIGSSLKFCLIAKGEAQLYPRMGNTYEWDTCASQIIVEESGAQILDVETKLPLSYGKPNWLNGHIICYENSYQNIIMKILG
jgi:3'(2'), 5'-bisphosphate nucleotidase